MDKQERLELLIKLGPLTAPFARNINNRRNLLKGEDKPYPVFNANNAGVPEDIVYHNIDNLTQSTYLWVIDIEGNILVLLEQTSNTESARGHICHTNITGGGEAYQGGELWFLDNTNIIINRKSGRYGGSEGQEEFIQKYFECVGYNVSIESL